MIGMMGISHAIGLGVADAVTNGVGDGQMQVCGRARTARAAGSLRGNRTAVNESTIDASGPLWQG
jgi:hypothetical protein